MPLTTTWANAESVTSFYDQAVTMTAYMSTEKVTKKKIDPRLLKDMENDLTDLLMHLFKGQPRVVIHTQFTAESFNSGTRHFERDTSRERGMYRLYYRGDFLGEVICRPHKILKSNIKHSSKGLSRYANNLLYRLVYELFPGARIETIDG